jgi:hypothetical protein
MKLFKRTFAFLAVALTLLSCGDDDDNGIIIPGPPVGVEVKYEVSASTNMVTKISYRMGDDSDTLFGALDPENPTEWQKILVALYTQMPETAFLEVKCINHTATIQNCTLKLYRGTELLQSVNGVVPPADDDDDTDDTVTTTATATIDQ